MVIKELPIGEVTYAVITGKATAKKHSQSQDNLLISPTVTEGGWHFLCVADGHGSKKCPRSSEGSRLAVECFEQLANLVAPPKDLEDFPAFYVENWQEEVKNHFDKNPLTDTERQQLEEKHLELLSGETPDPYAVHLLYGSTIVGVYLNSAALFCFQIGDGDILVDFGKGAEFVFERTKGMLGNETESLCMKDAVKYAKTKVVELTADRSLRSLQLSTDGYSNAFRTDEGFLKTITDIQDLITNEGAESVQQQIDAWLKEASDTASGDDISLVGLYRLGLEPAVVQQETTNEVSPAEENRVPDAVIQDRAQSDTANALPLTTENKNELKVPEVAQPATSGDPAGEAENSQPG